MSNTIKYVLWSLTIAVITSVLYYLFLKYVFKSTNALSFSTVLIVTVSLALIKSLSRPKSSRHK